MSYIDGFVVPVPAGNKEAYLKASRKMTAICKRYGAIRMVECWGDDVPDGKVTDFKRAVAAQDGEQVIFGWIEWPNKATRDKAFEGMMQNPELAAITPGFDMKRAIFGGFTPILDTDHA